ncbi:MAG: hypothetical protein PHN69_00235 [Candidatus Pacebacteria bacterium]|nr:hypothetical protein [Candidatus Paceibacterota bacterium]
MNKKNIFIIGIVLITLFMAGYYLYGKKTDDASLVEEIRKSESGDAKYIYNLLQKMSNVKLTDTIFSEPSFIGLRDNTVSLTSQEPGRNNPFAPIGTDSFATTTGSKSTTTINRNR